MEQENIKENFTETLHCSYISQYTKFNFISLKNLLSKHSNQVTFLCASALLVHDNIYLALKKKGKTKVLLNWQRGKVIICTLY